MDNLTSRGGAGHTEVANYLIKKGADTSLRSQSGNAQLDIEKERQARIARKYANKNGAPPADVPDKAGQTPLMYAAMNGDHKRIKVFLEKGDNPNRVSKAGFTPLIWASVYGHFETAKLLVENGADMNLVSNYGATALMYASLNGHARIADFLVEKAADTSMRSQTGNAQLDFEKERQTRLAQKKSFKKKS